MENIYEEKILERLRTLHHEEEMLYEILKESRALGGDKGETKKGGLSLSKKSIDNAIDLIMKYEYQENVAICEIELAERDAFGDYYNWVDKVLSGVALKGRNTPYETFYRVLESLGFCIEE